MSGSLTNSKLPTDMAGGVSGALLVALGGALGSMGRYGLTLVDVWGHRADATMAVNIAGCLLIGIISAILSQIADAQSWRLLVVTGFLGGFTTYSSFALDTVSLLQTGQFSKAAWYVAITVIGGFAACAAGYFLTAKLLEPKF